MVEVAHFCATTLVLVRSTFTIYKEIDAPYVPEVEGGNGSEPRVRYALCYKAVTGQE